MKHLQRRWSILNQIVDDGAIEEGVQFECRSKQLLTAPGDGFRVTERAELLPCGTVKDTFKPVAHGQEDDGPQAGARPRSGMIRGELRGQGTAPPG